MGERFTKKVSFEFRLKEWRGDGWGKWRREGWVEVSIKRWNWFTKWNRKFIPEMRRGILKRAIGDFQRRGGRRTNKCDNIRQMGLCRSHRHRLDLFSGSVWPFLSTNFPLFNGDGGIKISRGEWVINNCRTGGAPLQNLFPARPGASDVGISVL